MRAETKMQLPGDLLMESCIDAMLAIGNDDQIAAWNYAASILFNLDRGKAMGLPLFAAIPSLEMDQELKKAIDRAKNDKKSFLASSDDYEHRKHVETHIIPLFAKEKTVGVMLLFHDVSHRITKELELQKVNDELQTRLRQLNYLSKELSQLTHLSTHNIRGPIREIYTAVEGLMRTEAGVMSHSGRASFRRIQTSLNRMNLLLDDISLLTQINIIDRPDTMVNLEDLLVKLRKDLAVKLKDSRAEFTTGSLCEIKAHHHQVTLLLEYIFSNVIKFAGDMVPHLHLECAMVNYTPNNGETKRSGEYYLISITHNGSAFANIDPHITLQTANNADSRHFTGPVLAIVLASKIMEVHDGFLTIDKTKDGNTVINCYFPAK